MREATLILSRFHAGGSTSEVGGRFQSFGITDLKVVTLMFASWNQIGEWLRQLNSLRPAA